MAHSDAPMSHRLGRAAALAATLSLLVASLASAAPPGNNGTVKIHDGNSDEAPIIKNEPHVGCSFHLHFFFGDADDATLRNWRIDQQSPSGDAVGVLSGTYTTDADGGAETGPMTLTSGHYKLYWDGRNDQNQKHKTFWVECDDNGGGVIGIG